MGDYFHGWRRKIGVVTLVMACVFAAGWVRSHWIADILQESDFGCHDEYGSKFGLLYFAESSDNDAVPKTLQFESKSVDATTEPIFWGGVVLVVPYFLVVVPLIVLSAYLLLSNPMPPTSGPTHVEDSTQPILIANASFHDVMAMAYSFPRGQLISSKLRRLRTQAPININATANVTHPVFRRNP